VLFVNNVVKMYFDGSDFSRQTPETWDESRMRAYEVVQVVPEIGAYYSTYGKGNTYPVGRGLASVSALYHYPSQWPISGIDTLPERQRIEFNMRDFYISMASDKNLKVGKLEKYTL
jgi:hypothetical protein